MTYASQSPLDGPVTCVSDASESLPSERDIADYERHGWWISDIILPDALLDEAAEAALRYQSGERDRPLPVASGYSDWQPTPDAPLLRNNEFVSLQSDTFAKLSRQPIIGAIAARLARTSEIRLFDDQLIFKPPSASAEPVAATAVGWHADHAYWGTCSSHNMLTAWIPFHDVNIERGTMVVIDGSHRWPLHDSRYFNDHNLARLPSELAEAGYEVIEVPFAMRKGQVSFHHCWTLHASLTIAASCPASPLRCISKMATTATSRLFESTARRSRCSTKFWRAVTLPVGLTSPIQRYFRVSGPKLRTKLRSNRPTSREIGRASCRERVCLAV